MIPAILTAVLATTLLWVIYDDLVDKLILGEYQSVVVPLVGMMFFCEALFKVLARYI